MNLLLEKSSQMQWFADMHAVFSALPGICESHDWLISDIDCSSFPDARLEHGIDPITISGIDLIDVLNIYEIQFNWAVFSALPKGCKPRPSKAPYAAGNSELWNGRYRPQLKEAEFEIVCWDSCAILVIGAPAELAANFQASFPHP